MPAGRVLHETIAALDQEQRAAVLSDRHTVVLAGPGSGKTRTLVTKVAWALEDELRPPAGVACLTYARKAAGEFGDRLRQLGLHPGPRLFLGTAHAFCLTSVIPLSRRLAGLPPLAHDAVLTTQDSDDYLQQAADETGAAQVADKAGRAVLRDRRRQLINGEDMSGRDPAEIAMAKRYDELLAAAGRVDFDGMIIQALTAVQSDQLLCDVLAAAYRWLVVDEYQDLTPTLHELIGRLTGLHPEPGGVQPPATERMKLFAVGDPDQGIYGFVGGQPDLLEELTELPHVDTIKLRFNYRSGPLIIAAGAHALALPTPRSHRAAPSVIQQGRITPIQVDGGYEDHIAVIIDDILPALRAQTVPYGRIGILLQRQEFHPLYGQLATGLTNAQVPFVCEAESPWATTPAPSWLRDAATWSFAVAVADADQAPHHFHQPLFAPLANRYLRFLDLADARRDPRNPLTDSTVLHDALVAALPADPPDRPLIDWLVEILASTGLEDVLAGSAGPELGARDVASLRARAAILDVNGLPDTSGALYLSAVADAPDAFGRLTLTTFHKAKGREFDAVILPGLVESVTPWRRWSKALNGWEEPSPQDLREQRRTFYVALTRARSDVYLIAGPGFVNDYGYWNPTGPSRFFTELLQITDPP